MFAASNDILAPLMKFERHLYTVNENNHKNEEFPKTSTLNCACMYTYMLEARWNQTGKRHPHPLTACPSMS